ncbi:MAG: 23S rRNA (pseudouridine(1915)-N(3))-methyltransferase RlmH [Armatimonadetes bacterium]|nr:23S rRNA (pseudouridine(1915)-N(3))-methyltransferase RlmH [Armatimonadota bacterium]
MVKFVHLGTGGTHTKHVTDALHRASRLRTCRLYNTMPPTSDTVVAIVDESERLLDKDTLQTLLEQESVVFVIGDSMGVPCNIRNSAEHVCSLSRLKLGHQLQALVLAEAVCDSLASLALSHDAQTTA